MHYRQIKNNNFLLVSLAWRRASTFTARSKSSMTLLNSLPISSIFSRWTNPPNVLSAIIRICQIDPRSLRTKVPTFDIVAGIFRDFLHHSEHSRDCLLQDFCFFVYDFVCDLVRKKQNALQPIQKRGWHLVVSVLFLQEL